MKTEIETRESLLEKVSRKINELPDDYTIETIQKIKELLDLADKCEEISNKYEEKLDSFIDFLQKLYAKYGINLDDE